jgi:hypothetical protein
MSKLLRRFPKVVPEPWVSRAVKELSVGFFWQQLFLSLSVALLAGLVLVANLFVALGMLIVYPWLKDVYVSCGEVKSGKIGPRPVDSDDHR